MRFPNQVTDDQHYDTTGRVSRIEQHFYDDPANVYLSYGDLIYDYTKPAAGPTPARDTDSVYKITDPGYGLTHTYE